MRKLLALMIIAAAAAAPVPVTAASVLFNTGGTNGTTNSKIFTGSDGTKLKATAFSIDNTGKIVSGTLAQYSGGLGIMNSSGDDSHTIDNSGWKDFLLLAFDKYVVLNNAILTSNYSYNNGTCCLKDTDATIGALYNYGIAWNASQSGFLNQNRSVLNSFGLVTSSSTSTNATQTRDITPVDRGGTLWLVGAAFDNPDAKVDGFKFKAVTYSLAPPPPPPVPEPSTWALLIFGFGGVGAALRQRERRALALA